MHVFKTIEFMQKLGFMSIFTLNFFPKRFDVKINKIKSKSFQFVSFLSL